MSYCRNCGAKLEENVSYCPVCGTPVAFQTASQPAKRNDNTLIYVTIGIVSAVVAIAIIIVALIVVGLIPGIHFPGGIIGSGHTQTQQIALTDFSAISAGNGFQVQITQSNTYSVKITADDNLFDYILVDKTGSTLSIRLKPNAGFTTSTLRAEVSMPDLTTVQLSGGAGCNAQNINLTHDFTADLSGGARLTMTGQASNLTTTLSGGSQLYMHDFAVYNAHVDFSGGSQGTINTNGTLNATLSGGSHLSYTGNPTLGTIDTSGGSSISKIN
jgi:hypothetical protein